MANFLRSSDLKGVLSPHIDAYLARGKFPESIPLSIDGKRGDTAYHPSSRDETLTSPCQLFVHRLGVPLEVRIDDHVTPRKHPPSTQKNFHVGHMYHGWLQWVISEGLGFCRPDDIELTYTVHSGGGAFDYNDPSERDEANEIVQDGGWWAKGSIDIASCSIPGKGDFLVDIKTMGSFAFKKFMVPESYIYQLQLYMDWHDMDQAILLAVNKDTGHEFRELLVKRDPAIAEAVYSKWDIVNQAIKSGVVPDCQCQEDCPAQEVSLEGIGN